MTMRARLVAACRNLSLLGGLALAGGCDNGLGAPCGRHSECWSNYCSPTFVCAVPVDAASGDAPDGGDAAQEAETSGLGGWDEVAPTDPAGDAGAASDAAHPVDAAPGT